MNVHIANDSRMSIGGSWSFMDNLKKYAPFNITDEANADIFLISGVTTVTKDTYRRLRASGKPIVIRHDGIPEQHRNPRINIGARLRNWSREVDAVVYQSEFNKNTIGKLIGVDGEVIHNGTDTEIFNSNVRMLYPDKKRVLFVYWREDPNKRPDEIIVRFRERFLEDRSLTLVWAGKAPEYLKSTNFGFFNGENYDFVGAMNTKMQMASLMATCDEIWFPSFADTAPNTLIEALHCGCKPMYLNDFSGTKEYVELFNLGFDLSAKTMAKKYKELFDNVIKKAKK